MRTIAWSTTVIVVALAVALGGPAHAFDYYSTYPTELEGVTALSDTDAWAVGDVSYGQSAIIEHWDGSAWTRMSNPTTGDELDAVGAASSRDVWAVGTHSVPHAHQAQTLILHWDGSSWSRQASPSPSSLFNPLLDVSVLSSSDAWAVGYDVDANNTSKHHALALHWDGTRWSRVAIPGTEMYTVDAISPKSAWAAGFHTIAHWNGTKWSTTYTNPGIAIYHLSALSPKNIRAVGAEAVLPSGAKDTYVLHWNGTKWSHVPSPSPSFYNILTGVSAISANDAWAVGCHGPNVPCSRDTLILHWDGKKWSKVGSPHPGSKSDRLAGVSAASSGDAWAVGGSQSSKSTSAPLILHWNGTQWATS